MELVKNIFFNTDKLIQNSNIKISYTGELFNNNSEEVYIHYGFGPNWENVNELKMNKTELGYQAEINIPETNLLNFCFRDSQNNWDNNQNSNYSFNVEEPDLSLITQKENNLPIKQSKRLRKTYIWKKKIKLAVYKVIKFFPKIINGKYKKKINENQ